MPRPIVDLIGLVCPGPLSQQAGDGSAGVPLKHLRPLPQRHELLANPGREALASLALVVQEPVERGLALIGFVPDLAAG